MTDISTLAIAIMISNGFAETEKTAMQKALSKAGAKVKIISTEAGLVNGWAGTGWGHYYPVDRSLAEVLAADFDVLIVPGGERSILKLKQSLHTRRLVTHFIDAGKPVAAIGAALELLVLADRLRGKTVAAPTALATQLTTAGAEISAEPVCTSANLITACDSENADAWVEATLLAMMNYAELRRAAA